MLFAKIRQKLQRLAILTIQEHEDDSYMDLIDDIAADMDALEAVFTY
jgi:Asp-tRNA(Asn)/Glu-tRNA(Gln) amidotransferase C subunit